MRILSIFVAIVTIGGAIAACVTTPETNRQQFNFVSESQMNAMGEEAFRDIIGKSRLARNPGTVAEITNVGQRIARASGAAYDWEFKVIEDPKTINAFCLPGGKVGVYTGIIPVAKTNAGLAAVMGHEVAHAVLRHSAERMSQQLVMQLGLAVTVSAFKDSKYRNVIAGALGIGAIYGVSLPFSRFHESEADRVGLEYMAKAGYDPREAVTLWERMAAAGGGRPPEILSTHPDPLRRARELSRRMDGAMSIYAAAPSKTPTRTL